MLLMLAVVALLRSRIGGKSFLLFKLRELQKAFFRFELDESVLL